MFVVQRQRLVHIELGSHIWCQTVISSDLRFKNFRSVPYVVIYDPSFGAEGRLPWISEFGSPVRSLGVLFHENEL